MTFHKSQQEQMEVRFNLLGKKILNDIHTNIKLNVVILRRGHSQKEIFFQGFACFCILRAKGTAHTDVPLSFRFMKT